MLAKLGRSLVDPRRNILLRNIYDLSGLRWAVQAKNATQMEAELDSFSSAEVSFDKSDEAVNGIVENLVTLYTRDNGRSLKSMSPKLLVALPKLGLTLDAENQKELYCNLLRSSYGKISGTENIIKVLRQMKAINSESVKFRHDEERAILSFVQSGIDSPNLCQMTEIFSLLNGCLKIGNIPVKFFGLYVEALIGSTLASSTDHLHGFQAFRDIVTYAVYLPPDVALRLLTWLRTHIQLLSLPDTPSSSFGYLVLKLDRLSPSLFINNKEAVADIFCYLLRSKRMKATTYLVEKCQLNWTDFSSTAQGILIQAIINFINLDLKYLNRVLPTLSKLNIEINDGSFYYYYVLTFLQNASFSRSFILILQALGMTSKDIVPSTKFHWIAKLCNKIFETEEAITQTLQSLLFLNASWSELPSKFRMQLDQKMMNINFSVNDEFLLAYRSIRQSS